MEIFRGQRLDRLTVTAAPSSETPWWRDTDRWLGEQLETFEVLFDELLAMLQRNKQART